MPISVTTATEVPAGAELVGVPVATGPEPLAGGVDAEALRARGFEGKVGETAVLDGVVAVGVGPAGEVSPDVVRRASAALVKAAWKRPAVVSRLLDAATGVDPAAAAQAAVEGTLLGGYRFGRYKKDPDTPVLESVVLVGDGDGVPAGVERGLAVAGAVNLARDLVNTPSGDLTPLAFADVAVSVATSAGLVVDVVDEQEAARMGLGGITSVGRGSENPPRLVKLVYEPAGADEPRGTIAFVGKGITFDSGGLSIKTGEGMMAMKTDMSGAASVLAAMSALPALGAPVRVLGYLCLAENMPSGRAIRPGDVLTIRNGTTVEVLNTDAEGRLVLADGLSLAAEEEPDAIVDLATLTGACITALGTRIAGLMGNDPAWIEQVRAAADAVGEPVWHLPLPKEYRKQLDSEVADLKNISGPRSAGTLTAGLFLQEFVDGVPWAHLDIAGPSRAEDDADPHVPKGGTGFGVRTLVALAEAFQRPA